LAGQSTQRERIAAQIKAGLPLRKRLWQRLVIAKILNQGRVLRELHGNDGGLRTLSRRVRSGDPENVEAQAARRYWAVLFGVTEFRRTRGGEGPNALLNYGYAIIRSMVARAVCAAGLHPSIGLHHRNRYDAFVLADDLVEPLRPLVDLAVAQYVAERGMDAPLDRDSKQALGEVLSGCVRVGDERRTVWDSCGRMASSLAQVYLGRRDRMVLPEIILETDKEGEEGQVNGARKETGA